MNRFKIIGISMLFSTLVACDNNQIDSATEALDKQVDKAAQPKSIVQPYAQAVDEQVNALHTWVHTENSTPPSTDEGQASLSPNETGSGKNNE